LSSNHHQDEILYLTPELKIQAQSFTGIQVFDDEDKQAQLAIIDNLMRNYP
jgi:hypothetical protein